MCYGGGISSSGTNNGITPVTKPIINIPQPQQPVQQQPQSHNSNVKIQPKEPDPKIQANLNQYLLQELHKMKDDHQVLKDEILHLKLQNLKLDTKMKKLKNKTKELIAAPNVRSEPARVVYDLVHYPPRVKHANDLFVNMLGYSMEEVVGEPWQKFIHADYIEKTVLAILRNYSPGKIIEQCYKHKGGGYFLTQDQCIIFRDVSGKPQLVFVESIPQQTPSFTNYNDASEYISKIQNPYNRPTLSFNHNTKATPNYFRNMNPKPLAAPAGSATGAPPNKYLIDKSNQQTSPIFTEILSDDESPTPSPKLPTPQQPSPFNQNTPSPQATSTTPILSTISNDLPPSSVVNNPNKFPEDWIDLNGSTNVDFLAEIDWMKDFPFTDQTGLQDNPTAPIQSNWE